MRAEQATYFADTRYVADARRFDMGERDHFISLEMASIGMEMIADWGSAAIVERLAMLTDRLADGCAASVSSFPKPACAPRTSCASRFPGGMPRRLIERLEAENIFVAPRLGRMRICPHVYNDELDVDRFVAVMRRALS